MIRLLVLGDAVSPLFMFGILGGMLLLLVMAIILMALAIGLIRRIVKESKAKKAEESELREKNGKE